jgi:hypothetical protein
MKKILLSAFWIVVMLIGLVLVVGFHYCNAQSDISTSTLATIKATGGNGDLELTMTLNKTSYSSGEPVNLTLTITNISNHTINYTHTGLDFDFQVTNGTNNQLYQWSNFKAIAQFITIEPLSPGENRSIYFTWQQTCNFNSQVEGDPVSPGTYNIIGETGPTYKIQTTPIQITIANSQTSTPTPTPTVPNYGPTFSPTPTPTIPEFSWLTILSFMVAILIEVVSLKKKNCES